MAGTNAIKFFNNSAAGTSASSSVLAGQYLVLAQATWGGGNVQIQVQDPFGNWITLTTISANGSALINVPAGMVRAVAATGSAFYASMITMPTVTTR